MDNTCHFSRVDDHLLLLILRRAAAGQEGEAPCVLNQEELERILEIGSRARPAATAGLALVCRHWCELLRAERTVLAPCGRFSLEDLLVFLLLHPGITKLRLGRRSVAHFRGRKLAALARAAPNLTSLQLNYSGTLELSPELADFTSLRESGFREFRKQDFEHCTKVFLPERIGELKFLTSLTVTYLAELPASMDELRGLTYLDLRNLFRNSLKTRVPNLPSLEVLVLHWSVLTLDDSLKLHTWNMKRLRSLTLLQLPSIFCLHESAFQSSPCLETLRICKCFDDVSSMKLPGSFFQLTSLRELEISVSVSTSLTWRLPQFLKGLPHLQRLSLKLHKFTEAEDVESLRENMIGLNGTPLESLTLLGFSVLPGGAVTWQAVRLSRATLSAMGVGDGFPSTTFLCRHSLPPPGF